MSSLQFYSNDVCPFAYRVRLTLAEKAIAHEVHTIDLLNIPDWYYDISPTGKVPLVKHGNDVVWESTVINEFLEDAYPDTPLLPEDPVARAHARIWIEFFATRLSNPITAAWSSNSTRVNMRPSVLCCKKA